MKRLNFFIFLLWSAAAHAQNGPYKFSCQIDSVVQHDTVPWRYQLAAYDYAFIGEDGAALKTFDAPRLAQRKQKTPAQLDSSIKKYKALLAAYHPVPAKDYILKQAANTRLVIINEAHHIPRHRAFAASLLSELYALGYRFLGAETLNYEDTLLNSRKYPLLATGYYSGEPAFGNLLRTALQTGYTVFPYESKTGANNKEREIEQAEHIKAMLDRHPTGKFIIYCGLDHAVEDSMKGPWILAMAGRLKQSTGINPLTIDQVQLTETGHAAYDNPYRQAMNAPYPAVYIDSNGNAFNKASNKTFDAHVYHPTTQIINGRPDWLQTTNTKAVYICSQIKVDYPCLALAYRPGDAPDAVPVDIIELKDKNDNKKLLLDKRYRYTIVVRSKSGAVQKIEIN